MYGVYIVNRGTPYCSCDTFQDFPRYLRSSTGEGSKYLRKDVELKSDTSRESNDEQVRLQEGDEERSFTDVRKHDAILSYLATGCPAIEYLVFRMPILESRDSTSKCA